MWFALTARKLVTCLGTLWVWPAHAVSSYTDDIYKARPAAKHCPNCTTPTTQRSFLDIREQLQLEAQLARIKQKIIEGLGLKDVPVITSSRQTYVPPSDTDKTRAPDTDVASNQYKLDDIIAASEPPDDIDAKSVLQFKLPKSLDKGVHVRSGYMYVFLKKKRGRRRNRKITVQVSTANAKGKPLKLLSSVKLKLIKSGWQKIGLPPDLMTQALTNVSDPLRLHVRCKRCKGAAKPVMVVKSAKRGRNLKRGSLHRSRNRKTKLNRNRPRLLIQTKRLTTRSKRHLASCQRRNRAHDHPYNETLARGGNNCCKLGYYLNFTEIGWGDWIISPEGVLVSVCNGRCFTLRHSVSTLLLQQSSSLGRRRRNRKCQPTRSSDLTIVYFDQSLRIVNKRMQDMIVSRCGCRTIN